jgi:hypothetical protein
MSLISYYLNAAVQHVKYAEKLQHALDVNALLQVTDAWENFCL